MFFEEIQITRDEAIYLSIENDNLNDYQKVLLTLLLSRIIYPMSDIQKSLNKVFDREIYTHELGSSNRDNLLKEFITIVKKQSIETIFDNLPYKYEIFKILYGDNNIND